MMNDSNTIPASFRECDLDPLERAGPLLDMWSRTEPKSLELRSRMAVGTMPVHVSLVLGTGALLAVNPYEMKTHVGNFAQLLMFPDDRSDLLHTDSGEPVNLGSWRDAMWHLAPVIICGGRVPQHWQWSRPPALGTWPWSPGLTRIGWAEVTAEGAKGQWTIRISHRDTLLVNLAAGIVRRP
jgi:hypothetical protein